MISEYNKAKKDLLTDHNLTCQQFFYNNGYILESGYCKILSDDLESAKKLFSLIKEEDIRANWALFLISLIEGDVRQYPTYFELRNFLEIDLNILLDYYKGDYVEKIIRYSDFMFTINPEVHKFVGRVLYNNGYEEQAMFFLNRAKSYFYTDPELHYFLAYIFYLNGEIKNCEHSLKDCLKILPKYFPAENLLDKLALSDKHE